MPPAFNLSQDQTLKFNPKNSRNLTISASTTISSKHSGTPEHSPKSSTHTYRLFIFLKNRCFSTTAKRCAFYRSKTTCQALRAKKPKPTRKTEMQNPEIQHFQIPPPHRTTPSPEPLQQERPHYRELSNYVKIVGEINMGHREQQDNADIHPGKAISASRPTPRHEQCRGS